MKKLITIFILIVLNVSTGYCQEVSSLDEPLGWRIKNNGIDYKIYNNVNEEPDINDYRLINYKVYFRKVNKQVVNKAGVNYQMIIVPSNKDKIPQNDEGKFITKTTPSLKGQMITRDDFDKVFWIEESIIENNTKTEYFLYANDVFTGLLTAPFKYRLASGNSIKSVIDGDFNIAPFIGWKWRISDNKPFYFAPFGFTGITTLEYNSANNTNIIEADVTENGSGLTYGFGFSFKFGNVSPGFIIGWDNSFGNLGEGFIYKDKPWISFSVNYDFFSPKQEEEVPEQ